MEYEMKLPNYYHLVETVGKAIAILGCVAGGIVILTGLFSIQYVFRLGLVAGVLTGVATLFYGVMIILGSLASLGILYCFLSIVRAQIETRNVIVQSARRYSTKKGTRSKGQGGNLK